MAESAVIDVRIEQYAPGRILGVHEQRPRVSWRFSNTPTDFSQEGYELEITEHKPDGTTAPTTTKVDSADSYLVPWPAAAPAISSRQIWSIRVRVNGKAPWAKQVAVGPIPEDLFRREFNITSTTRDISRARLYITCQGVYEAEINGSPVGDYFLAPGWTVYDRRLQYQSYDVTELILSGANCLGVRVAEGWCPIRAAELYDGETYDARAEVKGWSSSDRPDKTPWARVEVLTALPAEVALIPGAEPVRPIERVSPKEKIITPSGKVVLDFGQNLVGVVEARNIKGQPCETITLTHAEVLEHGELGLKPLRACKARDTYTLRGDESETYRPRFTFHGFRYVQVDGWPSTAGGILESFGAIVIHTDMQKSGEFSCSNEAVNQLFYNVRWSMKGNFLSVPTDCPQRDERLGWTGDAAVFTPTATRLYKCSRVLGNWMEDVRIDQARRGGVPPLVCPDILKGFKFWGDDWPTAVWHDVVVLTPWALWLEYGDKVVLEDNYESMLTWLKVIPRNNKNSAKEGVLWDRSSIHLGDWLDPAAPMLNPQKAMTDPVLVAEGTSPIEPDAFLIHSLDVVAQTARVLGRTVDAQHLEAEAVEARSQFATEYIAPNGRLVSDSQTAYALAICFNLLPSPSKRERAGDRLVEIVRRNAFKIGTGFAGTLFVCEALVQSGHANVAFAMLVNKECPSWLYPVSMGATTVWERWDSMLPDGTINGFQMTSFNHYALGAIAMFLVERLAGLAPAEPGWKKSVARPVVGGGFRHAKTEHETPYGRASCAWELVEVDGETQILKVDVEVPPMTEMEVVLPGDEPGMSRKVGGGVWSFSVDYETTQDWPVEPITSPF